MYGTRIQIQGVTSPRLQFKVEGIVVAILIVSCFIVPPTHSLIVGQKKRRMKRWKKTLLRGITTPRMMYVITSKWSLNFKLNTTPTHHLDQITDQIYTQTNWDQPPYQQCQVITVKMTFMRRKLIKFAVDSVTTEFSTHKQIDHQQRFPSKSIRSISIKMCINS